MAIYRSYEGENASDHFPLSTGVRNDSAFRPFPTRCVAELRSICARRVLRAGLGVDTLKGPARRERLERDLFADPMPDRVEPCLAQLQSKAPIGDDWAFELKWDGYRLAVHIIGKRVQIIPRGGHDWTPRFPTIAHDTAAQKSNAKLAQSRG